MGMTGGYPDQSDIISYIADRGIEEVTEYNTNFRQEFLQMMWAILNATDWAGSLAVYCPTATTFNVHSGSYCFRGVSKTYTAGSAVDPTDNDTTYVWMDSDNTIDSGIDGSGWPATEHIKLAEIDVDSDGNITAIRDKRGTAFMNYAATQNTIEAHTGDDTLTIAESGSVHSNLGATGAVTLTLPSSAPAGTVFSFAVQAAYELRIDPGAATIRDDSGQTADKYKTANAIGESLTVIADANGDWATIAKNGTWTEEA